MKMRRITATLLVLALLLVCLPMQTFAEENGAYLLPSITQQLQSIGVTQDGVIVFTEMDDLKLIIDEAKKNPELLFVCYYNATAGLTFDEDMTIPENVVLSISSQKITVNPGKKLTIHSLADVGELEINGSLEVMESSVITVAGNLIVGPAGSLDLHGVIYMSDGLDVQIVGKERMTYGENAAIVLFGKFSENEDLRALLKRAMDNYHPNWYYHLRDRNYAITLTEPLTIPANCIIQPSGAALFHSPDDHPVNVEGTLLIYNVSNSPIDLGFDINILPGGTFSIGSTARCGGKIHNLGVIEIAIGFDSYNGRMEVASLQDYTDTEDGVHGEIRVMTSAGSEYPAYALPAFNPNAFTIQYTQEDSLSVWSLSKYQHPVDFADLPAEDYLEPFGEIMYFSTFEELRNRAGLAQWDFTGKFYSLVYNGTGDFWFEDDKKLTISDNTAVFIYDVTTHIPFGSNITLYGSLYTDKLVLDGILGAGGSITVTEELTINGQLNHAGKYRVFEDTKVEGFEKINSGKTAVFERAVYIENGEHLQKLCKEAQSAEEKWTYGLYVTTNELTLTEPLYVPNNCMIKTKAKEGVVLKGEAITLDGKLHIAENTKIVTDVTVQKNGSLDIYNQDKLIDVTMSGKWVNYGQANVWEPLNLTGSADNFGAIAVWYDEGGRIALAKPLAYADKTDTEKGTLYVVTESESLPPNAVMGVSQDDFLDTAYIVDNEHHHWLLRGYTPAHEHIWAVQPAVDPTCLDYGYTEGAFCSYCREVLVEQEKLMPQGHDYGLGEDGNPDFWDTTCDVCGAERVVDKHRPTHSMYRMYNPNSGEHFYTGSMEERKNLEAAGWKYEGVGFTFPATTGKPVYRLYDKDDTMEHLYTMDEAEKDMLLAEGWVLEGVAFNSGREDEVPQYRLHNPNATIGAYHFTASVEEKDMLIAAGWEYQGIGFYTCWQ